MKLRSSYIWAVIIACLIVGWMFSDDLLKFYNPQETNDSRLKTENKEEPKTDKKLIISAVKVQNINVDKIIRSNGITNPEFQISISSEIGGKVISTHVKEGQYVNKGTKILSIDVGTLKQKISAAEADVNAAKKSLEISQKTSVGILDEELIAAKAKLKLAEKDLEIIKKLEKSNYASSLELAKKLAEVESANLQIAIIKNKQNYSSEINLVNSVASLENAKSNLFTLKKQLKDSIIYSPVDGKLESLNVDLGERISQNNPVASILGMKNITLIAKVSQVDVGQIEIGNKAFIKIAGGRAFQGTVFKIASLANSSTRTFDVEINIPNPNDKIKAGMTSEVSIITNTEKAFGISPAHLIVDGEGNLFVKTSKNEITKIEPVKIVKSTEDQVYISGLNDGAILLTEGQAFVSEGDKVYYKLDVKND